MALSCVCDGCGKPTPTWEERGIYRKKQYCPECAKRHDAMEMECADAHAKAAKGLEIMLDAVRRNHFPKKGSAPDE